MEKLPFFHRFSTEGVKKILEAQAISLWNAVCATSVENSLDFRQNSFFVSFFSQILKSHLWEKKRKTVFFSSLSKKGAKRTDPLPKNDLFNNSSTRSGEVFHPDFKKRKQKKPCVARNFAFSTVSAGLIASTALFIL